MLLHEAFLSEHVVRHDLSAGEETFVVVVLHQWGDRLNSQRIELKGTTRSAQYRSGQITLGAGTVDGVQYLFWDRLE